jgi:hypothetical protein
MGQINPRGMFHTDSRAQIVTDRVIGALGRQYVNA